MEASLKDIRVVEECALFVQHDWFRVIRSSDPKKSFFVGYRPCGLPTKFENVTQKGDKLIADSPETVRVEKLEGRRLSVDVSGFGSSTFVSPQVEFCSMHAGGVQSVDVSCTGRLVVSSDVREKLLVWNADTAEIVRSFKGHVMDVNKCRFFPSGLVVLSAGTDMTARVWSVETGECPRVLKGHRGAVLDVGFIDRGREVLTCSRDGTAKMWSCETAQCVRTFEPAGGAVNAIAVLSTDAGDHICALAAEKNTKIFDVRSGVCVMSVRADCGPSTAVAFGNKGASQLFVGCSSGALLCCDTKNGKVDTKLLTPRGEVSQVWWNPSLGLVASFADGTVCSYELPIQSKMARLQFSGPDCEPVFDFSIASGGTLFTASRDCIVRKYSVS